MISSRCMAEDLPIKGTSANPIIVGIDQDYPPFEFIDKDGKPAGYDVDLIRGVASAMNLQIQIRPGLWSYQEKALKRGDIDVLISMLKTEKRGSFADFSRPHLKIHCSVFVRKEDAYISDINQLRDQQILVQESTREHEYLLDQHFTAIITTQSETEAIRRLAAGEAKATLVSHIGGVLLIRQSKLRNLRQVGGPLLESEACFSVTKGNQELLSKLDTGLAILHRTGDYDKIYDQWFSAVEAEKLTLKRILRISAFILIPMALLALGILVWNAFLRRQIALQDRANRELEKSKAFLNDVLDNIPLMLFAKDPRQDFKISLWNTKAAEVTGIRREEAMGCSDFDFFPEDKATRYREDDQRILAKGKMEVIEELLNTRHFGERHVRTHKVLLLDKEGKAYLILGISEDITEQKQREEALQQTQRLESLGVMAGGLAHDFNNILSAIMGHLNVTQLICSDKEALSHLKRMEDAVLRASSLTKQMLAYSGRGTFVIAPLDLNKVVLEILQLLDVSIPKKITREILMEAALPPIMADASQIQQVVMNLVTNASEAIGNQEGLIRISTRSLNLDEDTLRSRLSGQVISPGKHVLLEVTDSGCGIAPDKLERLFEPFFTTKVTGRGLGLSALLGILKAHHGGIRVESELGKGSTFSVFIPVHEGPRPLEEENEEGKKLQAYRRILLADDEDEVRQATASMLKTLGLDVLEARDGQDALDIFKKQPEGIDLIILDLTMPRMDGKEALKAIREINQDVKIILSSGYHASEALQATEKLGLVGFLPKPFRLQDLVKLLSI